MRRLLILVALAASTSARANVSGFPSSDTFPSTQVGQSSPLSFYIDEATQTVGVNTDTIAISYSCPDFTVTPTTGTASNDCIESDPCDRTGDSKVAICPTPPPVLDVACTAEAEMSFTVTFHPSVAATESCSLTIAATYTRTSTTTDYTLTLSGTGTPPPVHVTESPASVAFGGVRAMTTSTPVAITLTNSGGSTATTAVALSGTGFAFTDATPTSIGASSAATFHVTCSPTAVTTYSGGITVTTNDPSNPTISVPLSCSGISSNLEVTPSPVAIAATRVGEPVMQTITLTNAGAASATIDDVSVTGFTMVSAPADDTVLASAGTADVVVSFDAAAAGSATGNLHIDSDSGARDIPITAVALATSMSVTPDGSVDFGPVCAGLTATQTFSVIANADGPFEITSISDPGAPFTVSAPTLPAAVQGDAANTVAFMVTASPTGAGSAAGALAVTTDIPNGTPDAIELAVTGLPAGVSATPATLDLGAVAVHTTSFGQSVQLTNCDDAALAVTGTSITGDDAADFSIVQNPTSAQVGSDTSAAWLIVMNAETSGAKTATFEVDYTDGGGNAGSATVALAGEPFDTGSGSAGPGGGETGGSTSEKSSYYACSSGRAAASWPIALALAALMRRRRRR